MAYGRKLPSGKWQGCYDSGGRRGLSAGVFLRKSDALEAARERESRARRGQHIDRAGSRTRFGDYGRVFIDGADYGDEATRDRDRSLFDNHLLGYFGRFQLRQLEPLNRRIWEQSLRLSPATVALCRQLLDRIMEAAVEDHYIDAWNRARPKRRGASQKTKRADRWLTRDELVRLADAIHPRYRAVILTMGYLGLRFGEAAGLTVNRLFLSPDVGPPSVEVSRSLQERCGHLRLKQPKTTNSVRDLTLPSFLVEELANHLSNYPPKPFAIDTDDGTDERPLFVFTGREGGPLRKTWVRRHFKTAAKAAGLLHGASELRPHHLRHTCASLLIAEGARVEDLQHWLGHSAYQVTMDVYAHLYPERRARLAIMIDDIHAAEAKSSAAYLLHGVD